MSYQRTLGTPGNGTFGPLWTPNTWATFGDSITAHGDIAANGSGTGTGRDIPRWGWQCWANVLLNQSFDMPANYAVSGSQTSDILATQIPNMVAAGSVPAWATVLSGTNDINGAGTYSSITTNLAAIFTRLKALGVKVIAGTITPVAASLGRSTAQEKLRNQVNYWLKNYCPANGVVLVDWAGAMSNVDGTAKTGALLDGLHPTMNGALLMAQAFASVMKPRIPIIDRLPQSNAESPDPCFTTNPVMTGTGGTVAAAGATGAVAASWNIGAGIFGQAYSAVGSKVTRTDGLPGDWQQWAVASGSGVNQYQDATVPPVGSKVYALVEFQTDAPTGLTGLSLSLQANGAAGGSEVSSTMNAIGGDTYTGTYSSPPLAGVLRTAPVTILTGANQLRLYLQAQNNQSGNVAGNVRFGRVSIRAV